MGAKGPDEGPPRRRCYFVLELELVDPVPLAPVETPAAVPDDDLVRSTVLDPESPSGRTVPDPLAVPLAPIAPLPLVEPEAWHPASEAQSDAIPTAINILLIVSLLMSDEVSLLHPAECEVHACYVRVIGHG
jgi:hypothetical protein